MRDWKFRLNDWVIINQRGKTGLPNRVGSIGVVHELLTRGSYDYVVLFSDGNSASVKETEITPISEEHLQLFWDVQNEFVEVLYTPTNEKVVAVQVDLLHFQVEIIHNDNSMEVVYINNIKRLENKGAIMVEKENVSVGRFEKIARELGQFTDKKNKQYGSSVDATYEVMKVLMDRYKNEDDTYTIPQSLLQHILLQVRMMDKSNRIFQNPSGKGDSESPYKDLVGYSLIGVEMVERNKN
jgi:hypothetical protein